MQSPPHAGLSVVDECKRLEDLTRVPRERIILLDTWHTVHRKTGGRSCSNIGCQATRLTAVFDLCTPMDVLPASGIDSCTGISRPSCLPASKAVPPMHLSRLTTSASS